LIPASSPCVNIPGLAYHTVSSPVTTLGYHGIFVINSDQDISITFGAAASIATPTATSYRIPANQQTTFDLGAASDSLLIFNNAATSVAANIWIQKLSVV